MGAVGPAGRDCSCWLMAGPLCLAKVCQRRRLLEGRDLERWSSQEGLLHVPGVATWPRTEAFLVHFCPEH